MTSTLLESEAEFLARAREIGMDDGFVKSLQAAGIKTFGKLAYICAVSPQSGDDTPLIQAVQKLLSRDLTPGGLKISKRHSDLECDVRGELRLREAFTRRALAFDQIGLMSFVAQEAWHTYLFDSVTRDPPPGHKFTSIAQALNADRELWQILAQESRGSIKVIGGVKPPLDVFIERLQTHTRVNVCLANLPQATGGGKGDKGDRGGKADGKGDREGKGRGGRGKGRGDKGGQKRKWDDAQVDPKRAEILQLLKEMPKDCVSRMPKTRQFLCVLFQHGKCPDQSKARCDRGLHNCWHKDCLKKGVPYCECRHS
ncbi:F25B4.6 [Symbiodinium sp. CCMP2592]|nr:F25B4.6 [Symbiodinium sp. CCMP2592]